MKRALCVLVAACTVTVLGQAPDRSLFDAIRADDAAAAAARLAAHADANSRDDAGATPLMYAAIYSSVDAMLRLIDAGADVNAANTAGATALMWAADDPAKLRLLLEHGATVGAGHRAG